MSRTPDSERVADRDRAAPPVHPRVVGDAAMVAERQHLHGERLVELEQADVPNGQSGDAQRLLRRRDRAEAHDLRFDPGERTAHQPRRDRQPRFRATSPAASARRSRRR
jgi:hypothetical protein